jgi:hypothetical protein
MVITIKIAASWDIAPYASGAMHKCWWNLMHPPSGQQSSLLFSTEDEDSSFLTNTDTYLPNYS